MSINKTARPIDRVLTPLDDFLRIEASGGILLLLATVIALAWVNSPWAAAYQDLWQTKITVGPSGFDLSKETILWVNDGLMAVFFFVVGLEIKREVLTGQLSSPRAAALPIFAAIGGMAVPAGIYALFNVGGRGVDGWGIPMATDIAFALGILALIGSRAPVSLKIFLTALAIVDDLGAVLVIALFFTDEVGITSLGVAALFVVLLFGANFAGIRSSIVFFLLSFGLWVAFLKSGVHPTLAGVVAAMAIPSARMIDDRQLSERIQNLAGQIRSVAGQKGNQAHSYSQKTISELEHAANLASAPLTRLEHLLHPWVAFVIMPIFALANAGLIINGSALAGIGEPISMGIIIGLAIGKPIGVVFFSWIAVRTGIASLPPDLGWKAITGGGFLAGIGFTMSLFISRLALDDSADVDIAKAGILIASVFSAVIGSAVLLLDGRARRVRKLSEAHSSVPVDG
jgi:NhaA family Na+:H+ antiporter